MCYIGLDAGDECKSFELAAAFVADDEGVLRIEDTAAGKAHDVVQEAERALDAAVLIVDMGVAVVLVAAVDKVAGGLVVDGCPADKLEAGG